MAEPDGKLPTYPGKGINPIVVRFDQMAVWSFAMIEAKVTRTCSFGVWAEVTWYHPPEAGRK